jgi:hypothetical protein
VSKPGVCAAASTDVGRPVVTSGLGNRTIASILTPAGAGERFGDVGMTRAYPRRRASVHGALGIYPFSGITLITAPRAECQIIRSADIRASRGATLIANTLLTTLPA